MKGILYKNFSEINKLNKDIREPYEFTGTFKNDSSIIFSNITEQRSNPNSIVNPLLFIQHDNPKDYNYVYIEEFNRYYFITDIKNIRNNLWEFSLTIDVLMSYKTDIENLVVIVDKQEYESESNRYFDDGSYITENKTFIETISFPSGFNENPEYILITAGGGINA